MASSKKFSSYEVVNQLRHVTRDIKYPKNVDIDKNRSDLNYSLTPKRDISPYEYLKRRLDEVQVYKKKDINLMCGWVVTMPKDLNENFEKVFFKATYEFLVDRYGGEQNVVSCEIHKDEAGEPHMHFCFVPIVENTPNANMLKVINYFQDNPESNNTIASKELNLDRKTVRKYRNCKLEDIKKEKVSARDVLNKKELTIFHDELQRYLYDKKIPAKVKTGITKAQGGNITVEQLKAKEHLIKKEFSFSTDKEIEF